MKWRQNRQPGGRCCRFDDKERGGQGTGRRPFGEVARNRGWKHSVSVQVDWRGSSRLSGLRTGFQCIACFSVPRMKQKRDRHRFGCITFFWRIHIRRQNAMHPNQHLSHSHSMRRPTAAGIIQLTFNGCRVPAHPPWSVEDTPPAVMPHLMRHPGFWILIPA